MVHGGSEEETHADLWEAAHEGLVLRLDGSYKFLHDRVQEAAYSLIPEGERAAMHLADRPAARVAHAAGGARGEDLRDRRTSSTAALALITSRAERERVAELNLIAGKRAKGSTACASALSVPRRRRGAAPGGPLGATVRAHLRARAPPGRVRVPDRRALGGRGAARAALAPRRGASSTLAAVTCVRARPSTRPWIGATAASRSCLEYLRRVGVAWSPHPTDEEVRQEYERLWQQLGSRPIEELIDLPR